MSARKAEDSLQNLARAVNRLEEAIQQERDRDFIREATVQCFENAFELAWKTLKRTLESEGIHGFNTPRTVIVQAFQAGLIEDEEAWLGLLKLRNTTAHVYLEEEPVLEIDQSIVKYTPILRKLLDRLVK